MESHYKTLLRLTITVRKLQKVFFNGGKYDAVRYPKRSKIILELSKQAERELDGHIKMMLAEMEAAKPTLKLFEE